VDRCPSCRARFKGESTCYRCGADLDVLLRVENQSKEILSEALQCYQHGNHPGALDRLHTARRLDSSTRTKVLANFLSEKLKNPAIRPVGIHSDSATLQLTQVIINSVREVHETIGVGLILGAYKRCLSRELSLQKISFKRNHPVPVEYKGLRLGDGGYLDFLVEDQIAVVTSVPSKSLASGEERLKNWMRLGGWTAGLLVVFDASSD